MPPSFGFVPARLRASAGMIALAMAADLAISLLLAPAGDAPRVVAGFAVRAAFALLVGWWLGARAWPTRGRALMERVLRRSLRAKTKPVLVLTARPDREPKRWRRVFEVVAFAAGLSVILTAVLPLLGVRPDVVLGLGGLLVFASLWAAFALVPYWTGIRMGLRVVDPIRWTVTPWSRRYADRMRLSNGAILLVALGVFVNLAVRAGHSQDQALVRGVGHVLTLVVSILVVAATAVAYYSTREDGLVAAMEAEALAAGVRDARACSDGEFLAWVR